MKDSQSFTLVTGPTRGIGRAIALGLAADGHRMGLLGRSEEALKEVQSEILWHSPKLDVSYAVAHVENAAEVQAAIRTLCGSLGTPGILVNNAGVNAQGSTDLSAESLRQMMQVNFEGAWNVLNHIVPLMRSHKTGQIFNITSICGVNAFPGVGAYCASKHALHALSLSLFRELAAEGIGVTAIGPSWVDTEMAQHAPFGPEGMIKTEDIVSAIRFILSLSPNAMIPELIIQCRNDIV